jgi:hypothetical protein
VRRASAFILLASVVTACMGDDGATVSKDQAAKLVLQPGDLPKVWIRFDEGRQISADAPAGDRSDPGRFGRVEGWKARYRRRGGPTTAGPLVVESRVDLFESPEGAKEDFDAIEAGVAQTLTGPPRRLPEPDLGDEAVSVTTAQGTGPRAVRISLIAWREENVTAWVFANGFARGMSAADVISLARKQQRRIARAFGQSDAG